MVLTDNTVEHGGQLLQELLGVAVPRSLVGGRCRLVDRLAGRVARHTGESIWDSGGLREGGESRRMLSGCMWDVLKKSR